MKSDTGLTQRAEDRKGEQIDLEVLREKEVRLPELCGPLLNSARRLLKNVDLRLGRLFGFAQVSNFTGFSTQNLRNCGPQYKTISAMNKINK